MQSQVVVAGSTEVVVLVVVVLVVVVVQLMLLGVTAPATQNVCVHSPSSPPQNVG